MGSNKPNVQDSINCWLPPETGLRQQIDEISARHPHGFGGLEGAREEAEGTEVMDTMEDQLQRYMVRQRAWRKLRLALYWIRFVREKRAAMAEEEASAAAGLKEEES